MTEASRTPPIELLTRPIAFGPVLLALSAALAIAYADRSMPIPDEGAYLTAAVKILHGGVFYRDIDAYVFPGASYLLAGVMSIFGEHLAVARTLAGCFFCAMVLGVYACALALVDQRRAALCGLSLLSLKFFAFPIYTMFFYADPSLAAAILALALFLRHPFRGPSARLFGVGVLAGLSIVTKQSTGLYVAAVFGLVLALPAFAHGPSKPGRRLSELAAYGAGVLLVFGGMAAYFASQGLFAEMLRSGLLRPFTGYLPTSGISFWPPFEWWQFGDFPSHQTVYLPQLYYELVLNRALPAGPSQAFYFDLGELASRLVYLSIPLAFGVCAWLWIRGFGRRDAGQGTRDGLLAAALDRLSDEPGSLVLERAHGRFFTAAGVCLALTASAFPRVDFIHVITIYPAIVLVLFALDRPARLGLDWRQRAWLEPVTRGLRVRIEAGIVALVLLVTATLALRYDAILTHRVSIERADLWVKPQEAWLGPLIDYVQHHVPKGAPLFVYGHEAQWYYLSDRYWPHPFAQLYPGMTGDDTGAVLAAMVRKLRPPLILQGILAWKGMPPVLDTTPELARTITELYEPVPLALPGHPSPKRVRVWRLRE